MAKKKRTATKKDSTDITMEQAMEELNAIVGQLESGQEPLEKSLQDFEQGMRLLRQCHRQLESAAERIEIITRIEADGTVETEEFDGAATTDRPAETEDVSGEKSLF